MNPKNLIVITSLIIFFATTTATWAQNPLGQPAVQASEKHAEVEAPRDYMTRGEMEKAAQEYFKKNPERMGTQKPGIVQRVFVTQNNYHPPTQSQLDSLARQRAEELLKTPEYQHSVEALVNRGLGKIDEKGKFNISPKATQSDLEAADRRLAYVLQKEVRVNRQNISLNRGLIFNLDGRERANRWWLWILSVVVAILLLDRILFWTTGRGLFSRLRRGYSTP